MADAEAGIPRANPGWAEPAFKAALIVGIGLLLVGLAMQALLLVPFIVSLLVICCALGITLGAFGSLAVLNYKGLVVAGVATIAIILLLLVVKLSDSLVRIRLDGDVKHAVSVSLVGDEEYPAASRNSTYEFFILTNEFSIDQFKLSLVFPGQKQGDEETEIVFQCIPVAAVQPYLGSGRTLIWHFDRQKGRLSGLNGVKGREVFAGPCRGDLETARFQIPSIVGSAFAQDTAIPGLLADLQSDSASVRREARKQLSALGEAAIRPMMDYWAQNADSYRIRLGVAVALTEFLRDHKGQRKSVSALLTSDDLLLLASAMADQDRTLRIYATEFLYDLGDPRIVEIANQIFSASSDDGKFNLLVAISGAVPNLSAAQKANLREQLGTWMSIAGPQTQAKANEILEKLQ